MKTTYNLFEDHPSDSHDNPFPEPRTVPTGWDTAAFQAQPRSDQASKDKEDSQQPGDAAQASARPMEKFPKPSTTPKNWDVSALK